MSDSRYYRQGKASALNITASTQLLVVQAEFCRGQARLVRINVLVAGTTPGSANDSATIAGAATANQLCAIPNVVGSFLVDFPIMAGLTITPGASQVVAVSYD